MVLTLHIHIKALRGDVICNYCSFCRNKPTSTACSPSQFVFQKVIVCPFKSGISAENFYGDVNQSSDRVQTPGRGKFNLVNTHRCGSRSKHEGREIIRTRTLPSLLSNNMIMSDNWTALIKGQSVRY